MPSKGKLFLIILLLTSIYLLQGVTIGFILAIPLYLDSRGAKWKEQGTFNFVVYPFSLKLAWAPIIDVFYFSRIGRRKSWLIPLQILLGITHIVLSYRISHWISDLNLPFLTWSCFFIYFLLASQDISVDGWALTLLSDFNLQWASTCQTVGQTLGRFIGFNVLVTFESANFTNQFIRRPLSIPETPQGLFTLEEFVRFWGLLYLVVTVFITLYRKDQEPTKQLNLKKTYFSIIKLLKKSCVRKLLFIFFISAIGYAPTFAMTNIVLRHYGIPNDIIGLIGVPLILVKIVIPFVVTNTKRPLTWYCRSYFPRLLIGVVIAIYIWFTPTIIQQSYFYPVLIVFFMINEAFIYLMLVSRVGFYARVSDPSIGGTYITLLTMFGNLGSSFSSSAVLYAANWIKSTRLSYPILVGICFVFGCTWLFVQCRMMIQLEKLPIEKWHLSDKEDCCENKDAIQAQFLDLKSPST